MRKQNIEKAINFYKYSNEWCRKKIECGGQGNEYYFIRGKAILKLVHVLHERPVLRGAESMMVHIYDQMAYKLYGLTAEEIAIVEETEG